MPTFEEEIEKINKIDRPFLLPESVCESLINSGFFVRMYGKQETTRQDIIQEFDEGKITNFKELNKRYKEAKR